jgi:uncharacterized protein (TIGR02284 family)
MSMDVSDVRSTLNGLIEMCKDGQKGFLEAAHHVKDLSLKSMFRELSQQRSRFAGELQQEVTRIGGEPETSGSATDAWHRGWLDFKAKITGRSDPSIIKEAERGNDAAAKAYQKALMEELPDDIRDVVERQYKAIREAPVREMNTARREQVTQT